MIPLTQEQFRDALRKGKGRALLHIREFGSDGLDTDIFHACEHSLVFDAQCEGTRGDWLHDIVVAASLVEAVRPRVLAALLRPSTMAEFWDVAQLYSLAAAFAQDGNDDARAAIYQKFDRKEFSESWLGGIQLIAVDGLVGFLHVAEVVGERSENEPGFWDDTYLFREACERLGRETVLHALAAEATKSPHIRAFLDFVVRIEKEEAERRAGKPQESENVTVVLQAIEALDRSRVGLMRWGRRASEHDVRTVFERMLAERRPEQLQRYLQVFRGRAMPRIDDRMIELAKSGPESIRKECIHSLGLIKDERVRQLAYELLSQSPPRPEAISLLRSNYQLQDHKLIESALPQQGDDDAIHGIVLDIVHISKEPVPELLDCFMWAYEHSPCSMCRESVVNRMTDLRIAPLAVLQECLMDCSEETRKLAGLALAGLDTNG